MRRFLFIATVVFVICILIVVAHRTLAYEEKFNNAFVERLRLDSKLVDGHWTWREINPGHDTFDHAKQLLRREGNDGFTKQMTVIEAEDQVNWVKFGSPLWTGTLRSNSDLPLPHVDAVTLNLPQDYVRLSDVLLIYGAPDIFTESYGDQRILCFPQGICVTTVTESQLNRVVPTDDVVSIAYVIPRLMNATGIDTRWRGFRHY